MTRTLLARVCPALVGLALLLQFLLPVSATAQEGIQFIDVDLGTLGLADLKAMAPSAVFRPLDMIGVRAGAEAWSLGGAHVAGASGVGAIPFNPAGLGWLQRPSIAGDLGWVRSSGATTGFPDTFNIPNAPRLSVRRYDVDLKSDLRGEFLGAGTTLGLPGGRTLSAAISHRMYMDVRFPEEIVADLVFRELGSFPVTLAFDTKERGGVSATAATFAVDALPERLAVGVNLNYLDGVLRSRQEQVVATGGGGNSVGYQTMDYRYGGLSADVGLQLRREGLLSLGLRYTPAYTLEVTRGRMRAQGIPNPGQTVVYRVQAELAGYDMSVPSLFSIGGRVDVHSRVALAFEVNSQKWSGADIVYRDEFPGRDASPGLPLRDVTTYHVGAEARFLRYRGIDLPARFGYWRGPLSVSQLTPKDTEDRLLPVSEWGGREDINAQAFTLGLGFITGNVRYDLAYQILDYELNKFYFDSPYDPFINPQSITVNVDRRIAQVRLSASLTL